jgi:hypothetical protein
MSDSQLSQFVYRDAYLKRVWTVQVPYFNNLQRDELDYFYTYVHGMVMPFKWWNLSEHNVQPQQAPDTYYPIAEPGVLHFVRFGMDTLHFDRVFKDAWSATITLEEAHPIEIDWEGYTPSVDDVVDGLGNTGV